MVPIIIAFTLCSATECEAVMVQARLSYVPGPALCQMYADKLARSWSSFVVVIAKDSVCVEGMIKMKGAKDGA